MQTEKTILILNNDRNLRETLALIFRRAGYCVFSAIDVEHAQIYLRDLTCDLAILDLSVGDAEEIQIIADLRASHPQLPILLLAGNPPVDLEQFTKDFQITGYLQKPVDPAKILVWIEEEFKKKVETLRRAAQGLSTDLKRDGSSGDFLNELKEKEAALGYTIEAVSLSEQRVHYRGIHA